LGNWTPVKTDVVNNVRECATQPSLYQNIRQRMSRMPLESISAMFRSFGGYDTGESAKKLRVPVRGINGDRFQTEIPATRSALPDFDAVVLPHTGHYPMLECPDEFNRRLAEILQSLSIGCTDQSGQSNHVSASLTA